MACSRPESIRPAAYNGSPHQRPRYQSASGLPFCRRRFSPAGDVEIQKRCVVAAAKTTGNVTAEMKRPEAYGAAFCKRQLLPVAIATSPVARCPKDEIDKSARPRRRYSHATQRRYARRSSMPRKDATPPSPARQPQQQGTDARDCHKAPRQTRTRQRATPPRRGTRRTPCYSRMISHRSDNCR